MTQTTNGVLHLDESNFAAATDRGVALVDFWAPWCGPCRMMGPVLDELAADLAGRASVAKVNVDESPALAAHFRVQAIPLLVLTKNGREARRLVGVQTKSALRAAIDELLSE